MTTLRYLGKFLDDPLDVPAVVLDDVRFLALAGLAVAAVGVGVDRQPATL